MARIDEDPKLPHPAMMDWEKNIFQRLYELFRKIAIQLNALSEGRSSAYYSASSSPPSSGVWALGDFVANVNTVELGASGSKYIIRGWRCVAAGTPGTWVQERCLTGN